MYKPSYEVLPPLEHCSFLVRTFDQSGFKAPYHFHREYELTLIRQGSGSRYVGHHMSRFAPGDLVLVGSNLPHCWKLESGKEDDPADAIVVQFAHDFLGAELFSKGEFRQVHRLLQKSGSGIQFGSKIGAVVAPALMALAIEKHSFKRLMGLLQILQQLAASKDQLILDRHRVIAELSTTDQERIHPIFVYLVDNFRKEVNLNKAAAIAGMTPNAFCKYFKRITRKTFMETVIEYRLNYAMQQLVQTDDPISDICFNCGFNDVSHFYKMFRERTQLSPLHYRKKFMET